MISALADPILPVFLVLALGLLLGKLEVFSENQARTLNAFVFYIGQPALIILLAANAPFGDYDILAIGLVFGIELVLYCGVTFIAYKLFKRDIGEAILLGMTSVFVNHLYYVLPIVRLIYGPDVTPPVEAIIFVDVAVLFCGTIFIMELVSRDSAPLRQYPIILAKNPALAALGIGVAANLAGSAVPPGLNTFAQFAGYSAPPLSLFALGVMLSRTAIFQFNGLLAIVVVAKVVIHPLLAFGLLSFAGIPSEWSLPLILVAAGPCGAMPFVIALQYRVPTETMSKAILISTLLTLLSFSALSGVIDIQ